MTKKDDDTKIHYENDDLYEGEKDDRDRPHGRGKYIHHDEPDQIQQGRYEGEWKDGEKHGHGTHYYRNGDTYDGPWIKGKRHGANGTYNYYNKDPKEHISATYTGDWKNDMKHGKGIMKFTNGDQYDGHWEKGNMEGDEGTYTYADGSVYIGSWRNDNKHGKGVLRYANGDLYEGMFKYGRRHGKGKYTFKKGLVTEGNYNEDRRIDAKIIGKGESDTTTSTQYDRRQVKSKSKEQIPTTTSYQSDDTNDRESLENEPVLA